MIILDTKKAAGLFAKYNVPLSGYIVNRVIPESLAQQEIPDYLRNRLAMQDRYMVEIGQKFEGLVRAKAPLFEDEIRQVPSLRQLADSVFS
jgi:arsenite-transporting ATPase